MCDAEYPYHFYCETKDQSEVLYARMEWLEIEGKSNEDKREAERADTRGNHYRYKADVLLTGLIAWDREIRMSETFLEWMPEAHEPVESPAYQWFVRFKYMPIVARLDEGFVCWHDLEHAFGAKDVNYMFDTALLKASEVGSYTCAL